MSVVDIIPESGPLHRVSDQEGVREDSPVSLGWRSCPSVCSERRREAESSRSVDEDNPNWQRHCSPLWQSYSYWWSNRNQQYFISAGKNLQKQLYGLNLVWAQSWSFLIFYSRAMKQLWKGTYYTLCLCFCHTEQV